MDPDSHPSKKWEGLSGAKMQGSTSGHTQPRTKTRVVDKFELEFKREKASFPSHGLFFCTDNAQKRTLVLVKEVDSLREENKYLKSQCEAAVEARAQWLEKEFDQKLAAERSQWKSEFMTKITEIQVSIQLRYLILCI